jgi:tripartite-type tricarboxylate transporter receptor subunit TctC
MIAERPEAASHSADRSALSRRSFSLALVGACASACAAGLFPAHALAQAARTLRLVVGFPPGGSTDTVARLLGEAMRGKFEGPVIVDNKAGAGSRIAAESMKSAPADGSVVLIAPNPIVTMYPHVYKRLSYDPIRDLVPVARLATYPLLLSVGPAVPSSVKTLRDFVDWAKANPKLASFASPASGTTPHFVGVMVATAAGIELTHVPYRGDAPAVQDLIGGQIAMSINVPAAQLPHLASGKLRVLATTGAKRMAQLGDVPTLTEAGFQIQTNDWFGAFAPPGTPTAAMAHIQAALREALQVKDVQQGFAKQGIEPAFMPGDELARLIVEESAYWAKVVKATGFTPED